MDAADLKALFAEVSKKMNSTLEHVRHELAGVRTGRALGHHSRQRARRGLRLEDAAEPARRSLGAGTDAHRRAAVRPVAARRDREGDPLVRFSG
ncbi:MAG: hypothetical protein QM736_09875 [Vicinamibacterales bacterium]